MFYREAGQFKTSYKADQALMPILQDRVGLMVILAIAFVVIPVLANDFFLTSIMIPFLVFSLAAIGLNVAVLTASKRLRPVRGASCRSASALPQGSSVH